MAIVILSRSAPFPVGPLHGVLTSRLPDLRWTCGDEDSDNPDALVRYRSSQLICGRSATVSVFTDVRWFSSPFAGPSPIHSCHVEVGAPTIEDQGLSDRITVLVAATLMATDQAAAMVQLAPGGNWLDFEEARRACHAVMEGEKLTKIGQILGKTPASFMETAPAPEPVDAAPPPLPEQPSPDRLPTLALLFDAAPVVGWVKLGHGLNAIDPDGKWSAAGEQDGTGTLTGRGCSIQLQFSNQPIPEMAIAQALTRSFWISEAAQITHLRRHTSCLTINCDADCPAIGPDTVRQLAKVMAMALVVCAKSGPLAGVYNACHAALFHAEQISALVGPLGSDEVPIKLFIATAFHSVQEDAISLSTTGLLPFTGYEIEAWNAPGTIEFVGEKLNGLLRYLLINGPVIGDGETVGTDAADRSLRCFHGPSKAKRPAPVPALVLEFGGPEVQAVPPTPATARTGTFGRRPIGDLGRKTG